ncbi:DUF2000 domain-containing protein [Deinococcus alpinitundrae]|uniref:DUF2000 domain-containing protein n=1 Tax=Deinococcus alpinitundrae TaxID=468913 RepID=UPI00137B4A5E|nr:DUF2000 domain-containing protein [Deinococcus alpinitundrae]
MKCVLVRANDLSTGLAVNAAGVLAVTLGHKEPGLIPEDARDASGGLHAGLINVPLPILVAGRTKLKALRERAGQAKLTVVGLSDVAQHARTYGAYITTLATTPPEALDYLGLALCGPQKSINKLVGNLALYGRVTDR